MYSFGCMMAFVTIPNWNEIVSEIDENDVYYDDDDPTFGVETEPHVTILYGLHDTIPDEHISKVARKIRPIEDIHLTDLSFFDSEKFDVLKFDVENQYLNRLNQAFSMLPNSNEYPDYHPHLTVAYLKKGRAEKYEHLYNMVEPIVDADRLVYNKTNGERIIYNF